MPPDKASTYPAAAKPVNADQGFLHTMTALWPYMWPKHRADLRQRVVLAFALLVVTKVVTLIVPYTFKWATDGLSAIGSAKPLTGSAFAVAMASLPLTMIV